MRDDICTIPITEVFEEDDGCPICRMYKTVEDHIITYILGDAMMEPDVRIETNKTGFCADHLNKMMNSKGRLQLALMLQTHLDRLNAEVLSGGVLANKEKIAKKTEKVYHDCFICNKINWGMDRMIDTLCRTYETQQDFRKMFDSQSQLCLKHYYMLSSAADKKKMPKYHSEFKKNALRITQNYAKNLYDNVSEFCNLYDYRNAGKKTDDQNIINAVENTVDFLVGKNIG